MEGKNNEFAGLPLVLTLDEVQSILRVGRYTALNLFHSDEFPRLEVMKRNLVLKDSFIKWYEAHKEVK